MSNNPYQSSSASHQEERSRGLGVPGCLIFGAVALLMPALSMVLWMYLAATPMPAPPTPAKQPAPQIAPISPPANPVAEPTQDQETSPNS